MNLKRIPREKGEKNETINFTIRRIAEGGVELKEKALKKSSEIQKKLRKKILDRDERMLSETLSHLAKFIEKEKAYTAREVDALIEKAQRTLLVLQKKKNALLEKECAKKETKKSRKRRKRK